MSNYGKLAAETSDQYLAALDTVQQNFLKSFATFAASVPASPIAPPLAFSGLPTIKEVTEAGFSFAEKLLKQQQNFTQKLVATTATEVPTAPSVALGKSVSPKNKNAS